jgi:hypothetical protein
LSTACGSPSTSTGIEMQERAPRSAAKGPYLPQRSSEARSGTYIATFVRKACRQGPTPMSYWIRSTSSASWLLAPIVTGADPRPMVTATPATSPSRSSARPDTWAR